MESPASGGCFGGWGWGRDIQEGSPSERALRCLPGGPGRGGLGGLLHSLPLENEEPQGLWGSRPH